MKKSSFELIKLLVLAFLTPILVIVYTKIEHGVSVLPATQMQEIGITGITPVSIGLENNAKPASKKTIRKSDLLEIRYTAPGETGTLPQSKYMTYSSINRFAIVLF